MSDQGVRGFDMSDGIPDGTENYVQMDLTWQTHSNW